MPVARAHRAVGEHAEERQDLEQLLHHQCRPRGRLVVREVVRELRDPLPEVVDLRANVLDHRPNLVQRYRALVLVHRCFDVRVQRVQTAERESESE